MLHEDRLAGADVTRDHHKAFALAEAVREIRDGPSMGLTLEEEPVVRSELERSPAKPVKGCVHAAPCISYFVQAE